MGGISRELFRGENLISYSTGMSVRYEVSNGKDHDVILTCRAQNVGQSKALPHPESDRPAPFPVVVTYSWLQVLSPAPRYESRCIAQCYCQQEGMLSCVVAKDGPRSDLTLFATQHLNYWCPTCVALLRAR